MKAVIKNRTKRQYPHSLLACRSSADRNAVNTGSND